MPKPNKIAEKLKAAGHKLTQPRQKVITWIAQHKGVFSVGEIRKALPKLDKVSVYRTVELLTELDLIHPVMTSRGEQHYEVHGQKHHHHIVCTCCEVSQCIPCPLEKSKAKGFSNLHHSLVFTGLCLNCK